MSSLSNWTFTTHEQAAMDAVTGTVVLSTGEKARGIVQMCAYAGTTSTDTEVHFAIMPSRDPDGAGGVYAPAVADRSFYWGSVSASIQPTTQALPLCYGPFGTKGIGGASPGVFAIIPPNCLLIAYPTVATNGSVIISCVSAEMD